jgi:hypothetical protein
MPSPAFEFAPVVAPQGGWIAYTSNESGRSEIYVQRFPEGGRLQQVTTTGGQFPMWNSNGRELFYWTGSGIGVVDVEAGSEFVARNPRQLVMPSFAVIGPSTPYDVAPGGQRFVVIKDETPISRPKEINVVQGWFGELNQRAPAK